MHFHTSQDITFSHFPHRQRGIAIREPRHENDPQTVHHLQEPFATHSGKVTLKMNFRTTLTTLPHSIVEQIWTYPESDPGAFALVFLVLFKVPVTGHQRIQHLTVHTRFWASFFTLNTKSRISDHL
jgi:hypothetical protein